MNSYQVGAALLIALAIGFAADSDSDPGPLTPPPPGMSSMMLVKEGAEKAGRQRAAPAAATVAMKAKPEVSAERNPDQKPAAGMR